MDRPSAELLQAAWTQTWQVTALIVGVAVLARTLARNRPHLAHVLWLVVLVKCVTPPLWTSPSGIFCWLQSTREQAARPNPASERVSFAKLPRPAEHTDPLPAPFVSMPADAEQADAPAEQVRFPTPAIARPPESPAGVLDESVEPSVSSLLVPLATWVWLVGGVGWDVELPRDECRGYLPWRGCRFRSALLE